MSENVIRGIIVSYFLSREGAFAYEYLGYGTQKATHAAIGKTLGLKATTVKLNRDQFDSVTESHRVGWYQRALPPSRARIAAQFANVSRDALAALVGRILGRELPSVLVSVPAGLNDEVANDYDEASDDLALSARSATGRAAEEAFISFYAETRLPIEGTLVDCRNDGVGYDFRIDTEGLPHFVEVKGLAGITGGLLMTSKEWLTARALKNRYHLALVTSVSSKPAVRICSDPGSKLVPTLRFARVVQEQWTLSSQAVIAAAS